MVIACLNCKNKKLSDIVNKTMCELNYSIMRKYTTNSNEGNEYIIVSDSNFDKLIKNKFIIGEYNDKGYRYGIPNLIGSVNYYMNTNDEELCILKRVYKRQVVEIKINEKYITNDNISEQQCCEVAKSLKELIK